MRAGFFCVDLLLKAGAEVDAVDGDNWTPLQYASSRGYAYIVKLLLWHGADVNKITEHEGVYSSQKHSSQGSD